MAPSSKKYEPAVDAESDEDEKWSSLALDGVKLVLNNHIDEAEELFNAHQNKLPMAAGHCYLTFMVCT